MPPKKIKAEVELSRDDETIWLHVTTATGKRAAINLQASPIRHNYLTEWAEEQLAAGSKPSFDGVCQFGACQVRLPEGVKFCDRHE